VYTPVRYKILLYWLLLLGLILFGLFMSWEQQLLQSIIQQDKTRLSLVILLLLLVMTLHSGYRSYFLSEQYQMFDRCVEQLEQEKTIPNQYSHGVCLAQDYLRGSAADSIENQQVGESPLLAELLVEETRGPHQVGWFISGVIVKLGLLGTVIGFIIMLSSVSGLENLTIEDIKSLMQHMTLGMGVAMDTTLVALVCSILLSAQYLLLDRMSDRFVALTIELQKRHQKLLLGKGSAKSGADL